MQNDLSVLIIEDDELWAHKISYDLQQFGFQVNAVADCVEDALTAITKDNFDIALLDINLNGKNSGIELGKLINDKIKKPFIFITATSSDDVAAAAAAARPSAFLSKPVNTTSLFVSIQSAIHHFQSPVKDEAKDKRDESLFFFVKGKNRFIKIEWTDVVCLQSERNYTSIITNDNETHLIRSSLQRTLQYIIPQSQVKGFMQINRSEVIQVRYISEIIGNEVIAMNRSYSISDNYGRGLKERLNIIL